MATTRRAAIYARISRDREGGGLGVDRQRDDCQALADRLGWDVVAIYSDNDLSAYSGKPRKQYKALLEAIDAGQVNAVIAWHPDRLHRSPVELEVFIALLESRKVTVQTVTAGEIDLSTPTGRAVARTVGAWARQESEHKSERIKAQKVQARKRGAFTGGPVPFGWRRGGEKGTVPEIDRVAAREVKKASQRVAAGTPLARIAADWNAQGVRTARGGEWDFTTVRQVLSNSKNAGFYSKDGEMLGPSPLPPIISEDLYRAVMAVLRDRRRPRSFGVRWLLGGIATCGTCGNTVRSAKADGRFLYRCSTPGPGHVARAAEPADLYVKATLAARLAQPDLAGLLAPAPDHVDVDAVRADLVGMRARLNDLADSYADGAITRSQLERGSANLRERITAAEATLAAQFNGSSLTGVLDQPDPPAAFWRTNVTTQRAVLRELATVTLLPATRHGPLPDETLPTPDGPVEVRLDLDTIDIGLRTS